MESIALWVIVHLWKV